MKNRSLFSYLRSHEKPQAEKRNPHSSFYILHLINSSFNKLAEIAIASARFLTLHFSLLTQRCNSAFFILHSSFYILHLIKPFTQRYNFPKKKQFRTFSSLFFAL